MTQHPTLYVVDVRCSSCGASFAVRSTAEAMATDVCSNCHPAYIGRARSRERQSYRALQPASRARNHIAVAVEGGVDPPTSRAASRDATD